MPNCKSVELLFKDSIVGGPLKSIYGLEPRLDFKQPRIRGRFSASPLLDLKRYRGTATVDWVRIGFQSQKAVDYADVQNAVVGAGFPRPWVSGPNEEWKHEGDAFLVKHQNPTAESAIRLTNALRESEFGVRGGGLEAFEIHSIEVSTDWYSRHVDDHDRWLMVDVLKRHVLPSAISFQKGWNRPRHYEPIDGVEWLLDKSLDGIVGRREFRGVLLRSNQSRQRDLTPTRYGRMPIDRTFYIGARSAPAMLRVMDKVSDDKIPAKGVRVDLMAKEKRARIEVQLRKEAVRELGLETLDDLFGFNFFELRNRYFNFWRPTLEKAGDGYDKEWDVFSRSGVLGLDRFQRAWMDRERECCKLTGEDTPSNFGKNGRLVAFKTLNKRTEQALTHLSEDWTRGLLKEAA